MLTPEVNCYFLGFSQKINVIVQQFNWHNVAVPSFIIFLFIGFTLELKTKEMEVKEETLLR